MANDKTKDSVKSRPGNSQGEGINPSAPTTGTEQWGNTRDERAALNNQHSNETRAGQMKGNLGDQRTAQTQKASDEASSNKRPDDAGDNQADRSNRSGASAYSMSTSHDGTDRTFRCADAGNADCQWETTGHTDDEIVQRAQEHSRLDHGMADWTEAMRSKVKDAIRRREAA